MNTTYFAAGYRYESQVQDLRCIAQREGGGIYTAKSGGHWVVITDESSLMDLLCEEDQVGLVDRCICIRSFASEQDRDQFAQSYVHPEWIDPVK